VSSELAKTISTCCIWLATTVMLLGLFRRNEEGATLIFIFATFFIATAAASATAVVWQSSRGGKCQTNNPRGEDNH
jgi:hypothetical protein